jgi:hypothetical protein
MFNVYDPKTIKRGSVPVQVLPREQELELLRGLANPNDPNVPAEIRAAAIVALAKLEQEMTEEKKIFIQDWDVYVCKLPYQILRTRHIAGRVGWRQDFVVTPALISINSETREAEDETGAIYVFGEHVQGGPGVDTKWSWWRDKQGASDVEFITAEIKNALLSKRERK